MRVIAWKAQTRLCQRYRHMMAKGKPRQVVVTAIARELAGFVWAIACITSDPGNTSVITPELEEAYQPGSTTSSRGPRAPATENHEATCASQPRTHLSNFVVYQQK